MLADKATRQSVISYINDASPLEKNTILYLLDEGLLSLLDMECTLDEVRGKKRLEVYLRLTGLTPLDVLSQIKRSGVRKSCVSLINN